MRLSSAALCLLFLGAGPTVAQLNFLTNGDFSAGLTGWTGSGDGGPLGVVPFDTNGAGVDPAFGIHPGGNTFAPPHAPYLLKQQILALPNAWYELHLDVCLVVGANNAQGGYLKFSIGGVEVASWPEFSGAVTPGTFRRRLVLRFTQALVGPQDFAIEFWRELFVWGQGRTPVLYVDNVRLTLSALPVLAFTGERRIGGTLDLELSGQPRESGVILVAGRDAPAALTVPGLSGSLLLDPASLHFFAIGQMDPQGVFRMAAPIPNDPALAGVLLSWQGLAFTASFSGGFGLAHRVCVYR